MAWISPVKALLLLYVVKYDNNYCNVNGTSKRLCESDEFALAYYSYIPPPISLKQPPVENQWKKQLISPYTVTVVKRRWKSADRNKN